MKFRYENHLPWREWPCAQFSYGGRSSRRAVRLLLVRQERRPPPALDQA